MTIKAQSISPGLTGCVRKANDDIVQKRGAGHGQDRMGHV